LPIQPASAAGTLLASASGAAVAMRAGKVAAVAPAGDISAASSIGANDWFSSAPPCCSRTWPVTGSTNVPPARPSQNSSGA
jgi:hypothetical protein